MGREQQDERVAPRTNEGRVPLRQFLVVEMKKSWTKFNVVVFNKKLEELNIIKL